jgi:regulator of replication initiation timing
MEDRKYITDFVPEVCKGIKNKLDQLEDEDAWLRKENARLREALFKITYPNLYIDKNQYGATWKSIARKYYEIAGKALNEGNDER